jgi:hypothetical protein
MWEPWHLTTLWAFMACYRDSFTFVYHMTQSHIDNTTNQHFWNNSINNKKAQQVSEPWYDCEMKNLEETVHRLKHGLQEGHFTTSLFSPYWTRKVLAPTYHLIQNKNLYAHGNSAVCSHLLTLVPRSLIFVPRRWRRFVPPKRRFTQDVHGATSQKTAFFMVTAVKTSNLTKCHLFYS